MPASIFVPMVQAAIQNLGLAVFIALGMEEDDRNPVFLWERALFISRGCCYSKMLLQQGKRKQSISMFGSVNLFLGSTQPRRTVFLFQRLTVHHSTPAGGFPNVFSFLIIFHSLTHPPTTCNPPSCFTHNFTQESCWVCSLLLPFCSCLAKLSHTLGSDPCCFFCH